MEEATSQVLENANRLIQLDEISCFRPLPDKSMYGVDSVVETAFGSYSFLPSPELQDWVHRTLILEGGPCYNPDHSHLTSACIGWLWTSCPNAKAGNRIIGTAELPMYQGNRWQKQRMLYQLRQWFGQVPDFIITLYAEYFAETTNARYLAAIEHELYHCAQAVTRDGEPAFTQEGRPRYCIRGHDVEEFVGVWRRYGAANGAGQSAELSRALMDEPEVAEADIDFACGTCLRF